MSTLVVSQEIDWILKSEIIDREKREFSGFATLSSMDDQKDIIDSKDVDALFDDYYNNPVVLLYHDLSRPVGTITKHALERSNGVLGVRVWGKIGFSKAPEADVNIAWELLEQDILKGLSLRIQPESFRYFERGTVRKIIPKRLREITLTPVSAHRGTLVDTITKSLSFSKWTPDEEENEMELDEVAKLFETSLGKVKDDITKSITALDDKFSTEIERIKTAVKVPEERSEIMKSLDGEDVKKVIQGIVLDTLKDSKQLETLTKALGGTGGSDDDSGEDDPPAKPLTGYEQFQAAINAK